MTMLASSLVASVFLTQLTPIAALATPADLPEPAAAAVQDRPEEPSSAAIPDTEDAALAPDQPAEAIDPETAVTTSDNDAVIPTPDGGRSYFQTGGTQELDYRTMISFADLPDAEKCSHFSAWVLATDADGKSSWADIGPDSGETDAFGEPLYSLQLDETGMRYPGGELTLAYYGKKSNGFECYDMADPKSADSLIAYKTTTLNIDWSRPEIRDVYYKKNHNGTNQIHFEVDKHWRNFDGFATGGGLAIFKIENYGNARSQNVSTAGMPCIATDEPDREGRTCYFNRAIPAAGDAIGVAALPAGYNLETVTNWPPVDAIDYGEILSAYPKSVDVDATRAGPTDSANCLKLCAGDPIDTQSGNFYEEISDLQIDGRIGLEVTRRYAVGLLGTSGAFGNGWAMNYDMHIDSNDSSNAATVVEPSGNLSRFANNAGQYVALAENLRADLAKTDSGWEFSRWDENLIYVFDEKGQLTSIKDNNRNTVTVSHDSDGRVYSVSEGDRTLTFAWDDELLASVTDHTGRTVSYDYVDGNLISVTDPGGHTAEYIYDAQGRVTAMTNATGDVTANTYDEQGRVIKQTLPNGQVLDFSYGTLKYERQTNTVVSGDVIKTYVYDERQRIREFTDSSNPTAAFSRDYDLASNVTDEELIDGSPKSYAHTYADGNLVKTTGSTFGRTVSYEYDDEHRLTATVDVMGIRTETTYDDRGNVTQTKVIPTDDSAPRVTSYEVDAKGDVTAVTNPLGGRTDLVYDSAGQLTSLTDPTGAITTHAFDELGQLAETVSPGGNVAGITAEKKAKFATSYDYDSAGNVLSVIDAAGTTAYQYDAQDNPTSVTDNRGKTKNAVYDAGGNPTKITYPDGSTDEFAYDRDTGLRSSWRNPQGLVTTYEYQNGTVITTLPDGETSTVEQKVLSSSVDTVITDSKFPDGHTVTSERASSLDVSPGIGQPSHQIEFDKAGRMIEETHNRNSVFYAYDGFGQLTSRTGGDRDVSYEYDAAGNLTKTIYADGTAVSHETDLAGRTTKIIGWDGEAYDFTHTPDGQIDSMSSSSGLGYATEHDGLRLSSKTWKDASGVVLKNFGYQYEASGLMRSDSIDATERQFGWNDNGALATIDQDSITWDGRLLTGTGQRELAYEAASGRLAQSADGDDTTSYEYDARGNRTTATADGLSIGYTWNALNQLTKVGDTTFAYSADGIRTKVGNAVQVYDQGLKLLSDGEMKYLWSPDGALLAQAPLESTDPSQTQQAVTDGMNSVHAVLNQDLAVLSEYTYTAFGERLLTAGADVSAMGFTSEQHDDSGLIYLRYRYLDPTVGQFISVDPLIGSTLDPYGYASGNPLQLSDPLGLLTMKEIIEPLYEHSSEWSTWMGGLSFSSQFIPGLKSMSSTFAIASVAFGGIATYRSFKDGDPWGGIKNGIATAVSGAAIAIKPLGASQQVTDSVALADNAILGATVLESEVC